MDIFANRYRILSSLGAGGMGEVSLAEDTRLQRRVAIKFLHRESEHDEIARERLRREALAAAALDHPFICKVHEIGEADGRTFIVMEYVEGDTLQALARGELLPLRQIVEIANEFAQALEEAHRRGVVHRDLKPSNVMLTKQGHVKVMDFGLAKQTAPGSGGSAATMLTGSGTRLGTPAYMSPEQVAGSPLDARSDIFSFGVILHELTTGAHPFMRGEASETMAAILRDPPSSGPRDLESLPGFGSVTRRMLAKACAERYQAISELRVELEALRDRVWLSTTSAKSLPAGPAHAAERTPFVGRPVETAELKRLLDRMLTGQGGLVLVGGEPGIGKTRLARELLREAHQRGCLCLTGHCYEMEGAPPFAPFIEITEQSVRTVPQAVRAAMGEFAPEISVIVPSLRRAFPDIGPVPEVPAEQQRRLVFSAYLEYARRAAEKSPMVVLLDDLHWADDPSLQLMSHLAPQLSSMRLLVVGTYRDVELDVNRPFAKTLETLLRQRLASRISLRRLNESGVEQMLSAMSGSTPPSGLAKIVFRETEGNPFFVEEVYQHLAEEGKLFDEAGRWKQNLRVDAMDVPEGVRLVIGRRLDRLGEQARKALTAAAVIGRSFSLDLLEAVVDAPGDEVLEAVEEADRAQLVTAQTGLREARYEFVHELIRTTLLNSLSLPRRQRLHLKIADALERLRVGSLAGHASVLAHHLYQAGAAADAQRTAKFLAMAGRRAMDAGAFEEALETFDHLIGLELGEDDPFLAEAFERRGNALVGLQRSEEAIDALDKALVLYSARRDDAGIARSAQPLSFFNFVRGNFSEAVTVLNRGLEALSNEAQAERAVLQAVLAINHSLTAKLDEAWLTTNEAAATAEQLADPYVMGRVLSAKVYVQRNCLEMDAAIETGRQALALLRPEALWDRVDLMVAMSVDYSWAGHYAEAEVLLTELASIASRIGHHTAILVSKFGTAVQEMFRTGDLRATLAEAEGNRATRRATVPVLMQLLDSWLAGIHLYLGDIDRAIELLNGVMKGHRLQYNLGAAEGNLFLLNALAGRVDPARTLFSAVERFLPALAHRNVCGAWWALETAVVGLALVGDTERCGALYPSTLAYVDTGFVCAASTLGPGTPQLSAAIAAHAAGLDEKARAHFEIAAQQARDLPYRILQPTVQLWHGRMLAEQNDPSDQSRGRAMIEAAAADFRGLEMVLHADLAERFLRSG
jgi:predicted ATPase/predicted Ser/Thr protein kinase